MPRRRALRPDLLAVGLGVTNELTAIGYGETRPIEADDTTAELQQANRRIELRVL